MLSRHIIIGSLCFMLFLTVVPTWVCAQQAEQSEQPADQTDEEPAVTPVEDDELSEPITDEDKPEEPEEPEEPKKEPEKPTEPIRSVDTPKQPEVAEPVQEETQVSTEEPPQEEPPPKVEDSQEVEEIEEEPEESSEQVESAPELEIAVEPEIEQEELVEPEEIVLEEPEEEEEVISIDTISVDELSGNWFSVDEPSGNWFFKRHWYQKAQGKYGEIGATVSRIFQLRTRFLQLSKSVQSDTLDPFYKEIGFDLGEMRAIIQSLLQQLEELRRQKGELDQDQTELLEKLEATQEDLKQLEIDTEDVTKLDKAFEGAMELLTQQIDVAHNYQNQGLAAVQAIAQELNDLAAKAQYLKVRSYARSVKDIENYLARDLNVYFTRLGQQITQQIQQVRSELTQLKQADIDIEEEAHRLRGEFCPTQEVPELEQEATPEAEPKTVLQMIIDVIMWPFRAVGSFFSGEDSSKIAETAEDT